MLASTFGSSCSCPHPSLHDPLFPHKLPRPNGPPPLSPFTSPYPNPPMEDTSTCASYPWRKLPLCGGLRKRVVLADVPLYRKPERGYGKTERRHQQPGTRAHSPKPPFYKTTILFPLDFLVPDSCNAGPFALKTLSTRIKEIGLILLVRTSSLWGLPP